MEAILNMSVMKRTIVLTIMLVFAMAFAINRGLQKEREIPHASASSPVYEELKPNERIIQLGGNLAKDDAGKEIRIIQRGDMYFLQIKHADLTTAEYELKPEKKQDYRVGM